MKTLGTALAGMVLLVAGCGTGEGQNSALNLKAADKAAVTEALSKHGVVGDVATMHDRGGHWEVTIASQPTAAPGSRGGMITSPSPPYLVYKDGRVVDTRGDKLPMKQ